MLINKFIACQPGSFLTKEEISSLFLWYMNSSPKENSVFLKDVYDSFILALKIKSQNFVRLEGKEILSSIIQASYNGKLFSADEYINGNGDAKCEAVGACERCSKKCELYYEQFSE